MNYLEFFCTAHLSLLSWLFIFCSFIPSVNNLYQDRLTMHVLYSGFWTLLLYFSAETVPCLLLAARPVGAFVPLLTLPSVCVLSTSIALFKSHRWFWFACFASFPNEDVILVHSCQAPSALPSVFLYRLSFCFTPALPSWHPLLPGYIKLPAIPQHTAPCQAGDLLYTGPSSSNWRMKYSSRPNMHNNSKHCQSLTTWLTMFWVPCL